MTPRVAAREQYIAYNHKWLNCLQQENRSHIPNDAQYILLPTIEDTMKLRTSSLEKWMFKAKMRNANTKSPIH
jgi:hypothetical protein